MSQTEYDELSALCDTLLKEQDDLQGELEKARALKARGAAGKGARFVPCVYCVCVGAGGWVGFPSIWLCDWVMYDPYFP